MRKDGLTMATAVPLTGENRLRRADQKMGGEPPLWMQIFPHPDYVGEWEGKRTTWVTDDKSQRSIVEYFDAKGNPLPIDFEHQSDETDKGVIALAAGRIVQLVAGGKKGLLAKCEWNRMGEWVLREGLYYLDSPSFWFGQDDLRIYILRHLALTNNPASEKRTYVTDHSNIDYGMEKAAASARTSQRGALVLVKSSATATNRPISEASLRSKGGNNMKLSDFLSSLRYTLGRPVTVTGKEIRSDLMKIHDVVPDTDDMIFLESESESVSKPDETMTVAQLLGETALAAALEAASQRGAASQSATPSIAPILIALGAPANSTVDEAARFVVSLKANTVPVEEYQRLQQQVKTNDEEVLNGLIAKASLNKSMTPFREKEARRLASQNLDLAKSYIDSLAPLDLVQQTTGGTAPATAAAQPNVAGGAGDVDADEAAAIDESQRIYDENMAIVSQHASAGKTITYNDADKLRKSKVATGK